MSAHPASARLARWQVLLLAGSGGALWCSGIAWLLLHHLWQLQGPYGPEVNPGEPWMLRTHGAAVLGFVLGVGSLTAIHFVQGWHNRRQRWIGLGLLLLAGALGVSGYLLYYVADEDARQWISVLHWVAGIPALPLFLWHYRRARRLRRRARPEGPT
ncbi:hypothetical protein [Xanthomonas theicola]|uniref:DUF4405 domain-containing protein n=1 Tax=Xanthomonas theicola TaxID=56464 RepID=A0A2S6ZGE2_9XANT|nr:hypothetical protein [Xanthomonas theicola]PPT91276.1 hypothetical protein XthCFBP4691_08360 [Xanthomonas theicola]QNH24631.1 hypothetical protein G4Q83_07560 [Xanthomonas theicola]